MSSKPKLPVAVRRALAALERRELARRLWLGIGKTAAIWVGFVLSLYLLDRLLALPFAMRALLGTAALGWGSTLTHQFLWRPLRKRPSKADLAKRYEHTHPELNDCFSTAVDFANDHGHASPDLVAATTRIAEIIAPSVRPHRAVSMGRARQSFWLGLSAVAVLTLSAILAPTESSIFFHRLAGGESPWPSATALRLLAVHIPGQEQPLLPIEVHPGQFQLSLPEGSEPLIRIRAEGVIPERVQLHGLTSPRAMRGSGGGLFRLRLAPIRQQTQLHFTGGDDTDGTPSLQLIPIQSPRVQNWAWSIHPPSYTGEPAFSGEGHVARAPIHSTCEIRFQTKPIDAQVWVVQGESLSPLEKGSDGFRKHSFSLTEAGRLDIAVQGEHDFRDPRAASLTWEVIPDRKPQVRFLYPPTAWSLVPGGEIPLVLEASDDRKLTAVQLTSLNDSIEPLSVDLLSTFQGSSGSAFIPQLVPESSNGVLRLQLSAKDSAPRHSADGGSVMSQTSSPIWDVLPPEIYEPHFASRMSQIRVALENALELARTLAEEPSDATPSKATLQMRRRLARQFDSVLAQAEALLIERIFTPIDPLVMPSRKLLGNLLLGGNPAPGAVADAFTSTSTRPGGRSGMLTEIVLALAVVRRQPEAQWIVGLESVLESLLAWEDFQGAVDLLRELVQRQQNLLLRTQEVSGR